MKHILPLLLLALLFCRCAKSSTAPTHTLIGTWQMASRTIVTTYGDGSPTTTQTRTFSPNDGTLVFGRDEAKYDERGLVFYMGPYSYNGNTITYPSSQFFTTQTVLTLTAKTLVMVSTKRIFGDVAENTDIFNKL